MKAAGFTDYSPFIKAVFGAVQQHADEQHWLPVYWNLGDEPHRRRPSPRPPRTPRPIARPSPRARPSSPPPPASPAARPTSPHFRLAKAAARRRTSTATTRPPSTPSTRPAADWAFYNGGNRWTFGTYMYKAAKQFDMKFRLSWHWNVVAGDPYYALDCREDDYAWCNASPDGELIPSVHFEQLREGLDDYRRLLTLQQLVQAKPNAPAGRAGRKVLDSCLSTFKLGDTQVNDTLLPGGWTALRTRVDNAIEALRK